jgi:hypothetical protein
VQGPQNLLPWNTTVPGSSPCVGYAQQHRVHRLACQDIAFHVLHFLMERNRSLSNFCVHCETRFDVELYDLGSAPRIPLQGP